MAPRTESQTRAQKKYRASPKGIAAQKRWNSRRRETGYSRRWRLQKTYGITEDDIVQKLEEQDGVCAICHSAEPKGRFGNWHVDHDHITGEFRGLLCDPCNRGLGMLKDNREVLGRAMIYVTR